MKSTYLDTHTASFYCLPSSALQLEWGQPEATCRRLLLIKDIVVGDITSPENRSDIIIGMNTQLDDVRGIGKPFVKNIKSAHPIKLGSVITFDFDGQRELHMIICHSIGHSGWRQADQYVRYGMDYLWQIHGKRSYSIVNIGTGRIGKRDNADHVAIRSAIAASFLPVDLYILPEEETLITAEAYAGPPLQPLRHWRIETGEEPVHRLMAS